MRNAEQNQRMRDNRRAQILSCAVKLFATKGLAATKISDVAAAAEMSQGLLYHYFSSKEEMFVEIVRRAFERMNGAALELERAPLKPREKLQIAAEQILKSLEQGEDMAWYSTLISLASVSDAIPEEARAIIRRERDVPYEVVTRIVRAGQKDGSIVKESAEELATVFWTTIKGLALHKAAHGQAYRSPNSRILTRIFFRET